MFVLKNSSASSSVLKAKNSGSTIGNNKFVCNFSVATSEEWLDKATKQKKQKVEWHNISVFGKLAEIVSSSL
jgi:single-stranded DNA-binding protein